MGSLAKSCILRNLCANLGESPDARVTLILGDTVNPTAIINCLVNYIPSRDDGAHMLVVDLAATNPPLPPVPLLPTFGRISSPA